MRVTLQELSGAFRCVVLLLYLTFLRWQSLCCCCVCVAVAVSLLLCRCCCAVLLLLCCCCCAAFRGRGEILDFFRRRTTTEPFTKDVFIHHERRLGD